jgi:hypothetical protein
LEKITTLDRPMRRFFIILFIISVLANIVFKIRKNGRTHYWEEVGKLHHYKKISYQKGHAYFEDQMAKRHPEVNLKGKNSIICFWDSTNFDFIGEECITNLDSLAGALGKYSYNYVFATEMKEKLAIGYLERSGIEHKNLKIVGDMDDFISGTFNDYPSKAKVTFSGGNTKSKAFMNYIMRHKTKPYYLIMDTAGKILYYNNKCFLPSKDTVFMRLAKSNILTKTLIGL